MKKRNFLIILLVVFTVLFIACDTQTVGNIDSNPDNPPTTALVTARYTVSSYTGNNTTRIKYSYTYGDYDFYYIYLGKLSNIPIFSFDNIKYDGGYYIGQSFTMSNEVRETVSTEVARSSAEARGIAKNNTVATTTGASVSTEIEAKLNLTLVEAGVKNKAEVNWSNYVSQSVTNSLEITTSLTETAGYATARAKGLTQTLDFKPNENNKVGYYRWSMLTTSDVYLFVIKDSKTDKIEYEFKEYTVIGTGTWALEYSEELPFARTDDSVFRFDVSILDNLPPPKVVLTDQAPSAPSTPSSEEKIIREHFSTSKSYVLPADVTFPATIEIYVLGGGGGGQGGHRYERFLASHVAGRGAGGGGGAVAYSTLTANQRSQFDSVQVVIGTGGDGGEGFHEPIIWKEGTTSGHPGKNGGQSTVSWGSTTLVAAGGNGGGGLGGNRSGGTGGNATAGLPGNQTTKGNSGANGTQDTNAAAPGGSTGILRVGSVNPFPFSSGVGQGGNGGWDKDQSGSSGGNGEVIIIIKYVVQQ